MGSDGPDGLEVDGLILPLSLVTGNQIVDEQHLTFIALAEEIRSGLDVEEGLSRLVDHATSHFREEETLMLRCGYTDIDAHQREHLAFFDRVIHLRARWRKEPTVESAGMLVDEVERWLREHVLHRDVAMAEYLRGVVRSPVGM